MNREEVERVVFHAALLAGEGARAREVAHFAAVAAFAGEGRSCLDAGAPLQIFLDAPGAPALRFAVRLHEAALDDARANFVTGLADDGDVAALAGVARALDLPRARETFGVWFLRDQLPTLAADVRGAATERVRAILAPAARARMDRYRSALGDATPWAILVGAREGRVCSTELRWSLGRGVHPARAALALGAGESWSTASEVFARVLGEPPTERARPWQITTRLDDEAPVGFATSAWARRPDVEAKRERLLGGFEALGAEPRQADATWRLLRGAVAEDRRWAIGRGLEVRGVPGGGCRLRVVLVPAPVTPRAPSPAG